MKRKSVDPANLSVLDLLTNALAAMLILMFVLAAFRPAPGAYRTRSTLLIDTVIADTLAVDSVFVREPAEKREWAHFGAEVTGLTRGGSYTRQELNERRQFARLGETDTHDDVMVYRPVGRMNRQIVVVRRAGEGEWSAGVLYARHPLIEQGERRSKAQIRIWRLIDGQVAFTDSTVSLFGPSAMAQVNFELKQ